MQTQTGTRTRNRQKRCTSQDYSALLLSATSAHPLFWLLAAFSDRQKADVLERMQQRSYASKTTDRTTSLALASATRLLKEECTTSFKIARNVGLLPLCWEGTRALDEVEVPA